MIEIKDLLNRFREILLGEEDKKEAIRKILSSVLGIEIKPEDIKIKNGTLYLNIKPIYKNEILLKETEIFSKLKEVLGKKTPLEIR